MEGGGQEGDGVFFTMNRLRTDFTDCNPASRSRRTGTYGAGPLRKGGRAASRVGAKAALLLTLFCAAWLVAAVTAPPARAATPAGTVIGNTASASYSDGPSSPRVARNSNTVSLITVAFRTPSKIEFLSYAPQLPGAEVVPVAQGAYRTGGDAAASLAALAAPAVIGSAAPIDLTSPVPLAAVAQFHVGEPIFLRLTDLDQNLAPASAETVTIAVTDSVTGDTEVIRLTETGADTGVFAGYVPTTGASAASYGGSITVSVGSSIKASYTDRQDGTDSSNTAALIDPYGIIFDSSTGKPIDGVSITLIDAATGLPAAILGDDGVSSFPATLTSGGTASDGAGRVYGFPPGGFRYPFVNPGSYRFQVAAPAGYAAPSAVADSVLQALPGAPFALVAPGSRLEPFSINPGPALHIDIPLDPLSAALWLQKSSGKESAAVGDFVPFQLDLQNTDAAATASGVAITDTLPPGFRYRRGSARVNGVSGSDPDISSDGRTLAFRLGDLAPGEAKSVRYVVEVAAGAQLGAATNRAVAGSGSGVTSNIAAATVQVRSDFLTGRSIVAGTVSVTDCSGLDREEPAGVEGIRIFLEDGTYVMTDKKGRFHFEGVSPGSHVVQMDLGSIAQKYELPLCELNGRFAGTPYSQFVDLQGGTLWRADFKLALKPAATGEAGLELRSRLQKTEGEGRLIEYTVPMRIGAVPVRNLRLTVLLPEGAAYLPGSALQNGIPRPDPSGGESAVTFPLGSMPPNWEGALRFNARLPLAGAPGELATRALLTFDTPTQENVRTPVADNLLLRKSVEQRRRLPDVVVHPHFPNLSAELTEPDKKELDLVIQALQRLGVKEITVTGHTDSNPILGRGTRKFRDNYVLSRARAESVGCYLAARLKLPPERVTCLGKGPDEPVDSNLTDAGRANNRRVELVVRGEDEVLTLHEVDNLKDKSGIRSVKTVGLRPGEPWADSASQAPAAAAEMPEYNAAWLESAEPGLKWLWPPQEYHPHIPSLKLAVQHDPGFTLKLHLNGREVEPLYLEGTVKRSDRKVAVTDWRGMNLADGDNILEAVQLDGKGVERERVRRVIHYSTPPVKAAVVPGKSRLAADGKHAPLIAIRLTDKDGHPARQGSVGEFVLDPPYMVQRQGDEANREGQPASARQRPRFKVGEDGVALVELQPTTRSGEAVVRLNLVGGEQEVRAWLRPELRDWVLVGIAEGTLGYDVVSKNMMSAREAGGGDGLEKDGRLAFYAKGAIKGEWLLTVAYDNMKRRTGNSGANSLFGSIDPNAFYTLYGDATQQRYDAASAATLYLKIEREQFYALFGDFNTGLTLTELSRYSRSMNGLKSEYQGKKVEYNVFAARTGQAYIKDELRGDGTSGLYRLSRKNIVLNSEKVTVETRDRFHSETIVTGSALSRFSDYSIDYEAGTVFFKEPVRNRDENFNPIYVVVEYETLQTGGDSLTAGGRAGVKLLDDRLKGGASFVHEGRQEGRGNLYGADASYLVAKGTTVRGEVARSETNYAGVTRGGNAYLAEIRHQSPQLQGKTFYREQEGGFGLGQQNGSESGTRKFGGDAAYKLSDPLSLAGQAYRQYNLGSGAVQDVAEAKGVLNSGPYGASLGMRYANDRLGDGSSKESDQLTAGVRWLTLNKRLDLHLDHEQSIGGNNNESFPTRTMLGADFKLTDKVTLFAQQEFTSGAGADTNSTSAGMKGTPWEGGTLNASLGQNLNENGERIFALYGLKQTWKLNEKWTVDGGLDRSETIKRGSSYRFNTNAASASGETDDFTAVSAGAAYQEKSWNWNSRVEVRRGSLEDKWGVLTSLVGEPKPGWGWSARCQLYDTSSADGSGRFSSDLRLGLVHRHLGSKWIVLDRLDFLVDRQHGAFLSSVSSSTDSRRIVNNLNANYQPNRKLQLSFQYGAKYVLDTIDGASYRGYTDLIATEGRYDLTESWDLGFRESVLHSWSSGQYSYSAGPSIGYSVVKNAWITLGYNLVGFTDRDFSAADYTSQGPFLRFRFKFDQNSVKDAANWLNHD